MIENMFNQNCLVSRPATSNVNGILTKSFTEIGTYACRADAPRSATENTKTGASDWLEDRRKLYLEKSADIRKNDRVTLDAENYRVVNCASMRGLTEEVLYVVCEITNWK